MGSSFPYSAAMNGLQYLRAVQVLIGSFADVTRWKKDSGDVNNSERQDPVTRKGYPLFLLSFKPAIPVSWR